MESLKKILGNTGATLVVLTWIFPIYWVALTALKPVEDIMSKVPIFLFDPTAKHLESVFVSYNFGYVIFNSVVIVTMATIAAMRHEFGTRWMLYQAAYMIAVAWIAAVIVYQGGLLLNLG